MVSQSYPELGVVFIKVINRAGKIADSVINRVRLLGCGSHTPHSIFLGLQPPDEIYECQSGLAIHFEKKCSYETKFLAFNRISRLFLMRNDSCFVRKKLVNYFLPNRKRFSCLEIDKPMNVF